MKVTRILLIALSALTAMASVAAAEWQAHMDRGEAAHSRRDYPEAIRQFEAALAAAEAPAEERQGRVARSLMALGDAHRAAGQAAEAESAYQRSLAIALGVMPIDRIAVTLRRLGEIYVSQGRRAEAEPVYRRELLFREKIALRDSSFIPHHPELATSLHSLADLYRSQGRYAEAELLYRRSLGIRQKVRVPDPRAIAATLQGLGSVYASQGRYAEAEPLYRRALALREGALGVEHPTVAGTVNSLGELHRLQGRHDDAEALYRRALAIWEKSPGSDHPRYATGLNNLALLYGEQRRYADAEPLYRRALAIWERALGPEHPDVALALNNLALLLRSQGRYAEAEPLQRRSLAVYEQAFGPEHPRLAVLLENLANLYSQQRRYDEALQPARRATQLLAERFTGLRDYDRDSVLAEQRSRATIFELHLALLAAARPAAADSEAFEVAQLARASDTAEQVMRMAARHAAQDDVVAQIARARQDVLSRLQELDARIVRAASLPPEQRDPEAEMRLDRERVGALRARAELDQRIGSDFPQYRELTNPGPLALAEAQKLLGESEALLVYVFTRDAGYVWAARQQAAVFERLALSAGELDAEVRKLRRQLDLGPGNQVLAEPFDVESAHRLYRKLFEPVESFVSGAKTLLVVPDAALTGLPLGVLVTDLPGKPIGQPADHAEIAWLAKRQATTVLPSVTSLLALRAFARPSRAAEPFIGFGNPHLERMPAFAPLPETADELQAMARALNAPASSLHLGSDATEAKVKATDLLRYRNLAFATHAVMAGELRGLAEPALVLTPPEKGSAQDDGLLTAGEISQLTLNADWVILSACNTAAADGTPGAEGFSGLAKAFFYAGARSLLVSHWTIHSEAAQALTSRLFEERAKGSGKAEALRRSMLALMASRDKPYYAHPTFWAPFVIVGEGRAE